MSKKEKRALLLAMGPILDDLTGKRNDATAVSSAIVVEVVAHKVVL